jgi:hypothetical protein
VKCVVCVSIRKHYYFDKLSPARVVVVLAPPGQRYGMFTVTSIVGETGHRIANETRPA